MGVDIIENIRLARLPKSIRMLITLFLLTMALGCLFAVINTYITTEGMTYNHILRYYLGSASYPEQYPGIDFYCLVSFGHTHLIATGLMLFCLGLIFQFNRTLPLWLNKIVLVGSFAALFITEGVVWAIIYITPLAAYLLAISGALFGICVFLEIVIPLYEMWIKKEKQAN